MTSDSVAARDDDEVSADGNDPFGVTDIVSPGRAGSAREKLH
jgi:hypothetical protein